MGCAARLVGLIAVVCSFVVPLVESEPERGQQLDSDQDMPIFQADIKGRPAHFVGPTVYVF